MRVLVYIALLVTPLTASSQTDSLFDQAVLLMQKEQFEEAKLNFEEVVKTDTANLAAYYNLGLSFFELKDFGNAVWAFEKCLRMDPSNSDIENALTLCYLKIDPEGVLGIEQTTVPAFARINPFTWSMIGIISSVLIAICLIIVILDKKRHLRGFLIFSSLLLGAVIIFSVFAGRTSQDFRKQEGKAVITNDALIYLKDLTPSSKSIPMGTIVTITGSENEEYFTCSTQNNPSVIVKASDLRSL